MRKEHWALYIGLALAVLALSFYNGFLQKQINAQTDQINALTEELNVTIAIQDDMVGAINTHSGQIEKLFVGETETDLLINDVRVDLANEVYSRKQATELNGLMIADLREEFENSTAYEVFLGTLQLSQDLADTICKWHPGDRYCYIDIYRPEEYEEE